MFDWTAEITGTGDKSEFKLKQSKANKAKMCNGRRHVPLCPACTEK